MKIDLSPDLFEKRHNATASDIDEMLSVVGVSSLEELISQTIPNSIFLENPLQLPKPISEYEFLQRFKEIAQKNLVFKSHIGMGYYETITPTVILRNILENPAWYTAYTPYQAEIAQGRLEMLLNFQTLIVELTGMEVANASLLDEATAAAEAMTMLFTQAGREKPGANVFFVSDLCHPQTISVLQTRAEPLGIQLEIGNYKRLDLTRKEIFGVLLQYPATDGQIIDYSSFIESAKEQRIQVAVSADLLSLTFLKTPGEMGADVVVGSSQRFGIPMGYGGPHAAFFATKQSYIRLMPGRIIGVSKDAEGKPAYRMTLQTREQHIKREKATSNICTAQVLLAVMAAAYSIYHGPEGLKKIALRIHGYAKIAAQALSKLGFSILHEHFFDTIFVQVPESSLVKKVAERQKVNFRYVSENCIGISFNETDNLEDVKRIVSIFAEAFSKNEIPHLESMSKEVCLTLPKCFLRGTDFLNYPVFKKYQTEHELLRYLKHLENKDISLVHSMISLGSCTMKLNATTEMIPITWAEFSNIHPFAPLDQTKGYQELFRTLENWLSQITGFPGVSLQPNSGAQGEYAGLMVIRAYFKAKGESHRNIALIPSSAHGTNPASAVMAGMQVVVIQCDEKGNVDISDLKKKSETYRDRLAVLMITYPSTHGVFEEHIQEVCNIIHQYGGKVYMDGANMNAQVGLTSPAKIGADICHLNLHKTFCIPHGGGGPGMGPICCTKELEPFLPGHPIIKTGGSRAITPVSAAPWGSASILPISYAYIAMMGSEGLTRATKLAILNANYVKSRLEGAYKILYTNQNGRCAHEMIIDCREFKKVGIEVEDIAKRLMDYGFHAPTVSFPVPGTLMIEPTESESKAELDRFCDALLSIRAEIREIEEGIAHKENNVLKNAPHTQALVMSDQWNFPYSRQKAAYPLSYLYQSKVWATVRRIDSAYGDRNIICSCVPIEEYV
ncbi:MAG: aminomethyl-transferring glycine dehydrogenase [Cytophagales bacterium]|nr:aminomethyl-transferring glycine dehydrogenase [Cytophagales bacterium]MDW8383176.1 aminomethyl-transferring glycine dehydrogenase [Flammeovirgaceae bacterium]